MIKPRAIHKLPECDRCRFYCGNPYLFCAVMPDGLEDDFCPYFAPDPDAELEELWHPQEARYVDEELVSDTTESGCQGHRVTYNGEEIRQPPQRWTLQQQLELLDTHPMFTGKCPQCGYTFDRDYTSRIHFDCPDCGWLDDSL